MSNLAIIASQAFSPNKQSGLKLWLDMADVGSIQDTGNLADQVNDKGPLGNNATQTGSSRPTTNSRTINGLNVLDFDGVNDFMVLDSQPITGREARTIIVVGLADNADTANILIALSHTTDNPGDLYRMTCQIGLTISDSNRIFANDAIDDGINPAIVIFTNEFDSRMQFNVDNFQAYKNGGLMTSTSDNGPNASINTKSPSDTVIGDEGTIGGASRLNGVIGEIIIYGRVLPTLERQQHLINLSNKWNIPLV